MLTNILKFIGLLAGMAIINAYVPYGTMISAIIVFIALWRFVND